jgi:hypothetical protein
MPTFKGVNNMPNEGQGRGDPHHDHDTDTGGSGTSGSGTSNGTQENSQMPTNTNANADTSAAQAGSQTGQTQAESGAGYRSSGAEVTSDIAQAEAYIIQLKRIIAGELDHSEQLRQTGAQHYTDLNSVSLQALQNAVALSNRISQNAVTHDEEQFSHRSRVRSIAESELSRNLRTGAVADDRIWNINEDSAYAVLLAKVTADVAKAIKPE